MVAFRNSIMDGYLIHPLSQLFCKSWLSIIYQAWSKDWWYKDEDDTILLLINLKGLEISQGIETWENRAEIEPEQTR